MNAKISPRLSNAVRTLSGGKIKVVAYVRPSNFKVLKSFNVLREYPFINAVGIDCEACDIEKLAGIPAVEYVTEGADVQTLDDNFSFDLAESFVYSGKLTGKGVGLCILDTGVARHLDFCMPLNRLKTFKDFVNNRTAFYDDNGHGTFVAGVAAGGGIASGKAYAGVAPSAEITAVKVIGAGGDGGAFSVLDGMQWIIDNRKTSGVRVCCMSFGSTPQDVNDPLKRGAEVLVKNGITVVAASGNSGKNSLKSPAISPDVIGVGAVNANNEVADFTSRGYVSGRQKPEIYADGVDVISTLQGAAYGKMTGTSVAAPYVAGACCLLLEKFPSATPHRIKEMLLLSSKPNAEGKFVFRLD